MTSQDLVWASQIHVGRTASKLHTGEVRFYQVIVGPLFAHQRGEVLRVMFALHPWKRLKKVGQPMEHRSPTTTLMTAQNRLLPARGRRPIIFTILRTDTWKQPKAFAGHLSILTLLPLVENITTTSLPTHSWRLVFKPLWRSHCTRLQRGSSHMRPITQTLG